MQKQANKNSTRVKPNTFKASDELLKIAGVAIPVDVPVLDKRPIADPRSRDKGVSIVVRGDSPKQVRIMIESVTERSGAWKYAALSEIRKIASKNPGAMLLTEQLRAMVEPIIGAPPNDGRAWGGVMIKAMNLGLVENSLQKRGAVTSHGGQKTVWVMKKELPLISYSEQAKEFIKNCVRGQ